MKDQRQGASSPRGRLCLLGGVASLVLAATAAHAQQALVAVPPVPVVKASPSDGLGDGGYYLESDLLIRDDKTEILTARGVPYPRCSVFGSSHHQRSLVVERRAANPFLVTG